MADDLGADLDQPFPECRQRPVLDLLGQYRLLLLARFGHSMGYARTSALTPKADVRAPMAAFVPISSASPPGADLPGGVAEGPFLTQSSHGQMRQSAQYVIDIASTFLL